MNIPPQTIEEEIENFEEMLEMGVPDEVRGSLELQIQILKEKLAEKDD